MSLKEALSNIDGVEFTEQADLTKFSTMRLVAYGDLIVVESKEALIEVQKILNSMKLNSRIVGMGANQLLPKGSKLPYLVLKFPFDKSELESPKEEYTFPASVRLSTLTAHAAKFGLQGWESFTGIPASIGGAVVMNAGTNLGEIGPLITEVSLIRSNGEDVTIKPDEKSFEYRKSHIVCKGDVIYQVKMKHLGINEGIKDKIKNYLELRNKTQPLKEKTCGCVFKNSVGELTCRAGMFIDIMGLKGLTHNGIRVSNKHANFMENFGSASYEDILELIKLVKFELKLHYGVDFETEVKID
ncbi:FAD-binding protein [Halobacteriovorax sp. GB3]|uniref:UDP-N-acetylmuramate dehydrogenase n=1 Tax=Halobacteriovorax sp. GB3 TaxID=2719615 RepID=UPI00235E6C2C|nr:FAD-binding protein [Halobacteriovorax sp. GB3]MDD0854658.1 FAD-binding protein [Halobacteriovorax sp. GB3]